MKPFQLCLVALLCAVPNLLHAQLVFSAAADFGGRTGAGLFIRSNGQVFQLPTGFVEHNFPAVSRDSRFVVFSSPDGVTPGLQVPPSSDIYVFDRSVVGTRRIVNHTTEVQSPSEVLTYTPVSAAFSPNDQLLAYGVMLTRREGTANARSTRELNIARASDGLILSNPTFGRGPVTDAFQAEFVGIFWDPSGESFVTPSYVNVIGFSGLPTQLPAIVRFARSPNSNTWFLDSILSEPAYNDTVFPPAAQTQIYPSLSPSGTGLAYFRLTWLDALGGSQGVFAELIIADSDGSNARVLATFDQGTYPVGVAWIGDGTSLIYSTAPQVHDGTAFKAAANAPEATIRSINTSTEVINQIPGIDAGFFPTYGYGGNVAVVPQLPAEQLRVTTNSSGQLRLSAVGVDPQATYSIQSATTLEPEAFGAPQSFTGAQLLQGIDIPTDERRFYRFAE